MREHRRNARFLRLIWSMSVERGDERQPMRSPERKGVPVAWLRKWLA
jgi:hypothetical protein